MWNRKKPVFFVGKWNSCYVKFGYLKNLEKPGIGVFSSSNLAMIERNRTGKETLEKVILEWVYYDWEPLACIT